MCHPLRLSHVAVDFEADPRAGQVTITARVRVLGPTGVEMEALTAVSVAALTLYDMCKSTDREMVLTDICLVEKSGGRSGRFRRRPPAGAR
jgi:cyclic pyranopterin phosphate synthase